MVDIISRPKLLRTVNVHRRARRISSDADYYQSPNIHARLIEYLGGTGRDAKSCTAQFLVAGRHITDGLGIPGRGQVMSPSRLYSALASNADVYRSLWDRTSTVSLLDIDYVNIDHAGEAIVSPASAFASLEPVFEGVRSLLVAYKIHHMAIMTGQGYHFVWRISDGSAAAAKLQGLGRLLPTLEEKYRHDHPLTGDTVPLYKGRSHAGLGLVMEYLAHRTFQLVRNFDGLPVTMTGLMVGSRRHGRESVSLDMSAFGDPLYMRYTRCAFSMYCRDGNREPALKCLPRGTQPWCDLLPLRRDPGLAAEYARHSRASIPEASAGTARLLSDYMASGLRRFHEYFESGKHDEPSAWPRTYDRLDLALFPPCVAWPLLRPNTVLADPVNIQNIARVLVAAGWHPRSVAGLIRSKFERDHGWGPNWLYYDAATRADFYVRLFCGIVATGMDDLRDFNCISHQEKGYCPKPWCGFNLAGYSEALGRALKL